MSEITRDGMIQCTTCSGSGQAADGDETSSCPQCGGSGLVTALDAVGNRKTGTRALLTHLAKAMVGGILGGLTVLFILAIYAVLQWEGEDGAFYPFGIIISTGCFPTLFIGMLSGIMARIVLRRRPHGRRDFVVGYFAGLVLTGVVIVWLLFDWMYPYLP